jgi:hypothetical protein
MTAHETGTSGHYPIKAGSGTYSTTTTMWAKQNDTVTYVITEGDGSTVHYLDLGGDSNQDPTASGTGTYPVMSSGASWSHTLTSATNNAVLDWYYFGGTVGTGGGRKYSNRIITRRVAGTIAAGTSSVVQGSTIAFSVSGMAGLPTASGSSNYFYIGIRKGGTMVHTNNTAAGVYWDSSNNQLGKVHAGDTSTTMTAGSSLTAGTDYTAHLYHYNPAVAEPFYNPVNQLSQVSFSVTSASASGPSAFDSGLGNDGTNLPLNQQVTSSAATISGMSNPTSQTVTASPNDGQGSPQVSVAGGTYATSATVTNGQTVTLRFNASGSNSTTRTGTLTINGVTGSVAATTLAATGGGGTSSGGGSSTYGLEVVNASGSTIFGPNMRSGHAISSGNWSANANSSSTSYTVEGMTSSNRDTVGVLLFNNTTPFAGWFLNVVYGSGSFYVQNNGGTNCSGTWLAMRY